MPNCVSKTTKTRTVSSETSKDNPEVLTASLGSTTQSVHLRVCRLCETRDGPFFNIFATENGIAKKIDELMPFWVAENDDLPHKICFRCSAKVDELYEFIQKCVATQGNLRKTLGKEQALQVKSKPRVLWEQKLNKSNISNDDICNELVKQVIQSKMHFPFPLDINEMHHQTTLRGVEVELSSNNGELALSKDNDDNIASKVNNGGENVTKNSIIGSKSSDTEVNKKQNKKASIENALTNKFSNEDNVTKNPVDNDPNSDNSFMNTFKKSKVVKEKTNNEPITDLKPFDIMDHVTTIKIRGVGVLFQCKICNRNFLKDKVLLSHACAKTGVPKVDIFSVCEPPKPPQVPTVKYINTRSEKNNINGITTSHVNKNNENQQTSEKTDLNSSGVTQAVKKKIGPASKIGRQVERSNATSDIKRSSDIRITLPNITQQLTDVSKCESPEIIDLVYSPDRNKSEKLSNKSKKNKSTCQKTFHTAGDLAGRQSVVEQQIEPHPYPVGLFKSVSHRGNKSSKNPVLMKLLSKEPRQLVQAVEDVPNKRKRKIEINNEDKSMSPYSHVLEDTSRPNDLDFFTFVNVYPLLQPSHVLPMNNIIQESQRTTSTYLANNELGIATERAESHSQAIEEYDNAQYPKSTKKHRR